jgi:hypothetical protein
LAMPLCVACTGSFRRVLCRDLITS